MKHSLKVSEDGLVFTVTTEGNGDVEGIIIFLNDIISHSQWRPGLKILLDHRELKLDSMKVSGIEEVSKYFRSIAEKLGHAKVALVMKRDIDFGIVRAWEGVTEHGLDTKIYVFREMEKAINWLSDESLAGLNL